MQPLASGTSRIQEFNEQGFIVIPNALSPSQLAHLHQAVDRQLQAHPDEWVGFGAAMMQCVNILPTTSDFDGTIENPVTLSVLRTLLGDQITFEELSIMIRNPTDNLRDIKGWHRDLTRDYQRRKEIDAVSLVYYLTDVSETDHCFSIIPESHDRLLDLRPEAVAPGMEFDVLGPAGTALIFHARCIHAGKLKAGSRQRRTIHIYYARAGLPRTSEWSDIPPRLYEKRDPVLPPRLYSKWNLTDVFDGTGKKPCDLPVKLSAVEMLKIVQQRANVKPVTGKPRPCGANKQSP